jgi:hypothetical protein
MTTKISPDQKAAQSLLKNIEGNIKIIYGDSLQFFAPKVQQDIAFGQAFVLAARFGYSSELIKALWSAIIDEYPGA